MTEGQFDLLKVHFVAPVEGIDPWDGDVYLSTRHKVAAVYLRQDHSETLFINDEGEVVARWATRLIDHVEWPDQAVRGNEAKPRVGTLEWRKQIQERHRRAYQRWTPEEDAQLTEEYRQGLTVTEMAERHERRSGGITARLVRLGLVEPDVPERRIGKASTPRQAVESPSELGPESSPVRPQPPKFGTAAAIVEVRHDRCRHELAVGTCSICKHDSRPSVYITAGGVRFHADAECPALLEGQRHVDARGGTTEPIELVHRGSARLEGRDPCFTCRPE